MFSETISDIELYVLTKVISLLDIITFNNTEQFLDISKKILQFLQYSTYLAIIYVLIMC